MKVKVLLFAAAREIAGVREVSFDEVATGTTCSAFFADSVLAKWPSLKSISESIVIAVNQEYVDLTAKEPLILNDGTLD